MSDQTDHKCQRCGQEVSGAHTCKERTGIQHTNNIPVVNLSDKTDHPELEKVAEENQKIIKDIEKLIKVGVVGDIQAIAKYVLDYGREEYQKGYIMGIEVMGKEIQPEIKMAKKEAIEECLLRLREFCVTKIHDDVSAHRGAYITVIDEIDRQYKGGII